MLKPLWKLMKLGMLGFAILFVVTAIGLATGVIKSPPPSEKKVEPTAASADPAPAAAPAPAPPPVSAEERVKAAIRKALGSGASPLVEVKRPPAAPTMIDVTLTLRTASGYGLHRDVAKVLRAARESGFDYSWIRIEAMITFIDPYGNESPGRGALVSFDRDAVDRINWNNFDERNLPRVARSWSAHRDLN